MVSRIGVLRGWLALSCTAYFALTSGACDPIQSTYVATPIDTQGHASDKETTKAGLVLSGQELPELSSPTLGAIEVTFENRSNRWLHVRDLAFSFGSDAVNQSILVPSGTDLDAWMDTVAFYDRFRTHGTGMATRSLSVAALASSLSGRSSRLARAPYAAPLSVAELSALRIANDNAALEALRLPAEHLLASPISVPPGLFAKRWILFYTPDPRKTGCVRRMQLGYRLDEGQVEYVSLRFREAQSFSPWQADACVSQPVSNIRAGGS